MIFVTSSQHVWMACFVNQVMSVPNLWNTSQLYQWIESWMDDLMNVDQLISVANLCYNVISKTLPMTFWTWNTIMSTSWVAICSIRALFRCLHSNTWTPKACITYFTITQAFYIWISSIRTQMECWLYFCWTECSFWTRLTFDTPSGCIWAS